MVPLDSDLIKCSLFRDLDVAVIEEILSRSTAKNYSAGDVLIRKGSVPEAFFIIRKGKVGIYNEDILLAELEDWAVMGESFLDNETATATIVVSSDLTTIEIKKDIFHALTVKYPTLMSNIFKINFQRLRNSNEVALAEAHAREEKLRQQVIVRTKELNETLEELRATNAELSTTRDNLIHTQKFREQFLANMSHEIRTPMNAIVGLTNLLIKSPANILNEKYLQVIKKSGASLLVIINEILDLAKIEAGKMELESLPFSLPETVNNIYTILSLNAEEKEIYLKKVIDEGVPEYVIGDENRFMQVMMNLAGNAIKFTEKGGVIISVTAGKNSNEKTDVTFSVKDSGIGIPPEKFDAIFESFGQASADTTRKFGGSGLGLTISKQLVEMHGSELKVKSKVGEGSEFYFTISYKVTSVPEEIRDDSSAPTPDLKGKKVLLVEDNEFNQMVAVDTLHDLFPELEVDVAENGKVAIEKATSNKYDLVFMDIQLPDIDGFEVSRAIRRSSDNFRKNLRICAMTASVTKERVEDCFEAGMNDYMMKPFDPDVLKERVLRNIFVNDKQGSTSK